MANVSSNESSGVFKSAESTPQKFKAGTNSAVSDVAVERSEESAIASIERRVEGAPEAPTASRSDVDIVESSLPSAPDPAEELRAAAQKAEAIVESIAEREAKIEESYRKAEAMLNEVERIKESLTFDDALRRRIEATVARTRGLRGKS
ncbi:MAG: hypothetical protein ACKODA_12410 [Nevskiaceae bacterium]